MCMRYIFLYLYDECIHNKWFYALLLYTIHFFLYLMTCFVYVNQHVSRILRRFRTEGNVHWQSAFIIVSPPVLTYRYLNTIKTFYGEHPF